MATLLLVACGGGFNAPPPLSSDPYLAKVGSPALAVGAATANTVTLAKVAGIRVQGMADAVTLNDSWHLASCGKAMTASLGAVAVERGKISWAARVKDVLPGFSGTLAAYDDVTLEQLLSHRAGVPSMRNDSDWASVPAFAGDIHQQRIQFSKWLFQKPPAFTPGTGYLYSNAGYAVAAAMIEEALGKPWETAIFEDLLTPLGLRAKLGFPTQDDPNQPWGHIWNGFSWMKIPASDRVWPAAGNPAGELSMSLGDFLAWAQINLRGLRGTDSAALKASSFKKLHTPVGTPPGQPGYGLGWEIGIDGNGKPYSTHSGSMSTFFALTVIEPDYDLALALIANGMSPGVEDAIWSLATELSQ